MGIRTGIIKTIYPDTTIPGLAVVPMESFEVKGNTALLEVKIAGGGCGSLTFTAEKSIDREATYAKVIDRNSPWSMTVTEVNAPGLYIFELQGLKMFPVDFMRLSYQAEIQAGDVEVKVFNYQETGGASVHSSIGDVIADMGDIDANTAASAASLAIIAANLPSLSMFVQECEDATDFAAVGDAGNLADDTEHVTGTVSVEWDKPNRTDVVSGVDDTIPAVDLSAFSPSDYITACFFLPGVTNVVKVYLQVGTDNANYTQWDWVVADLVTGWNFVKARLTDYAALAGTGMQQGVVTYVQAAFEYDVAAIAKNDMKVDHIAFVTAEVINDPSTAAAVALLTTIDADTSALAAAAAVAAGLDTDPQTGTGAIAYTTSFAADLELVSIMLHLDIAGTTAEDFEIDLDSLAGATYDANLLTLDLSDDSLVDVVLTPEDDALPKYLVAGDELKFTWPNTEGRTWTLRIVVKGV